MRRSLLYVLTGLLVLGLPCWGWALPSKAQSSGAEAPKPAVRKAALRALSAQYPESADYLKVRVRRVRGTLDPEAGLQLVFPGGEGRPTGLTQVDLRTRGAEGDWATAGWALLHVARLDSVATLRARALRGAPIAPSDLETAWLETASGRYGAHPGGPRRPRGYTPPAIGPRAAGPGRAPPLCRRHRLGPPRALPERASCLSAVVYRPRARGRRRRDSRALFRP
mgnify:CR=1 FL=1